MIRFFCFILTLILTGWQVFQFANLMGVEEERDLAIRNVLVWKGVVRGTYENNQKIKITITRNHNLPDSEIQRENIRTEILSQPWIIFQNNTDKELGKFYPRELVWELKSQSPNEPGQSWEAILWGDVETLDRKDKMVIQAGSYIAKYKEEYSYVEPDNFYGKTTSPLPKRIIHPKDGKEMLLVSRGVFLYGQGLDPELPSFNPEFFRPNMGNLKELNPFYMDKYEVTNREYFRYIRETGAKPPKHWKNGKHPSGMENHPVDFLSFKEVEGYANWVGKRIPTEWEWEKAARGEGIEIYQNRDETLAYYIKAIDYPFGKRFDAGLCNTLESKIGATQSVYELPKAGSSPYGLIGMCGNVSEWTNTWYDKYPSQPFNLSGYGKMYRVVRGGSYREDQFSAKVHSRSYGGVPNLSEDYRAGFRLVEDIK
jgi:formylglycine-generating enzyme required for sulfatase activity